MYPIKIALQGHLFYEIHQGLWSEALSRALWKNEGV
jgi:hypothetical protein